MSQTISTSVSVTIHYGKVSLDIEMNSKETLKEMLDKMNKFRQDPFTTVLDKSKRHLDLNQTIGQLSEHYFILK